MTLSTEANYTSKDGAERLASHIRDFWHKRGRTCYVYTVQQQLPRGVAPLHDVRSRMIGGMP